MRLRTTPTTENVVRRRSPSLQAGGAARFLDWKPPSNAVVPEMVEVVAAEVLKVVEGQAPLN